MKPFAQSCAENQEPILEVLKDAFAASRKVLEIGSGTGQHAVYFARHLPALQWQTSDLPENHPGIRLWIEEAGLSNVLAPLTIDARNSDWPVAKIDAVFSANAVHIMSWAAVESLFRGIGKVLPAGRLALYGPFNYGGKFTSESNARFDLWLKGRDPLSGVRDFEAVHALAEGEGFRLVRDWAMPANNRTLVWER